jgi:hypothetical protein
MASTTTQNDPTQHGKDNVHTMIRTERLKTEHLVSPRGIAVPAAPGLTWTLVADCNDERQTACEIEVDRQMPDGSKSLTVSIPPDCRGRLALAGKTEHKLGPGKYEAEP